MGGIVRVLNLTVFVVFLALGLLSSGCTTNLRKDPLYRVYLHKELTLTRPARLIERKYSNITLWHGEVPLKKGELYQLVNVNDKDFARMFKFIEENKNLYEGGAFGKEFLLPKGAPLKIRKIYSWMDGSGNVDIRAEGMVYFKESDKYVPFEFTWGKNVSQKGDNFAGGKLVRAPWEPDDVAAERTVQYNGLSRK